MDLTGFAESIGGEMVMGCVIATVNGKRQFVYRNGQFTPKGHEMYSAWNQREPEPDVAIAVPEPEPRRKHYKSGR